MTDRRTALLSHVRSASAAGFIVTTWLASVCNLDALCDGLDVASLVSAALYLLTLLGAERHSPATPMRRVGRFALAITCGLNLVCSALATVNLGRDAVLETGHQFLDVVAWTWALAGGLAAARWLWGSGSREPDINRLPPVALRHGLISAVVALTLALQVWALFRPRPTLWPFIDYPLYSAAHGEPIRAVHHRLYALTREEPVHFLEVTPSLLGASWFVYHTQVIPRLFNYPDQISHEFLRTLRDSSLPSFQLILPERTTYALVDGEMHEFAERRLIWLDPINEARD